jgi:hypothetical protein
MLGDSHWSPPARLDERGRPVATLVDLDGRACDGRREAALAGQREQPRWLIDGHAQLAPKECWRVPTPQLSPCKVELLNPLYVSNKTHNLSTDLRLNRSKESNHERSRLGRPQGRDLHRASPW